MPCAHMPCAPVRALPHNVHSIHVRAVRGTRHATRGSALQEVQGRSVLYPRTLHGGLGRGATRCARTAAHSEEHNGLAGAACAPAQVPGRAWRLGVCRHQGRGAAAPARSAACSPVTACCLDRVPSVTQKYTYNTRLMPVTRPNWAPRLAPQARNVSPSHLRA